ncbi:MAG: lyase family protein [Evtepia gabavorous]
MVKSGRTHLQDAVPITLAQEISGWRTSLEKDRAMVELALPGLRELALGGTAVGTGLNAPKGFDTAVAEAVARADAASPLSRPPTSSTPSPARTSWCSPTGRSRPWRRI